MRLFTSTYPPLFVYLLLTHATVAQDDAGGGIDYPLFFRMNGFYLVE